MFACEWERIKKENPVTLAAHWLSTGENLSIKNLLF